MDSFPDPSDGVSPLVISTRAHAGKASIFNSGSLIVEDKLAADATCVEEDCSEVLIAAHHCER